MNECITLCLLSGFLNGTGHLRGKNKQAFCGSASRLCAIFSIIQRVHPCVRLLCVALLVNVSIIDCI